MPIESSKLKIPDPFKMNEDTVNIHVASYLVSKGFSKVNYLTGQSRGFDVYGKKDNLEVLVESKGSHPNNPNKNKLFDNNQLWDHLCHQICKLLQYRDTYRDKNILLVAANPDISRIRKQMDKIRFSVEDIGIVNMWIKENGDVTVIYPKSIEMKAKELI